MKRSGTGEDDNDLHEIGNHALTRREKEILSLVAEGQRNTDIALCLGISKYTVKVHLVNIFFKLGASHRKEAVKIALREGQLTLQAGGCAVLPTCLSLSR